MTDRLSTGTVLVVNKLLPSEFSRRMANLGIIEGCRLYIKSVSPLGDPLIVTARNTDYAVRRKNLLAAATIKNENCACREPKLRKNDTI